MERTKNRALVQKTILGRNAIIYAIFLGLVGFIFLALFTNLLTVFLAFIGFFFYVVVYGIGKRRSIYGTLIGSISGAVPPVVGYCAVSNRFDMGAFILFMILVFWQMPHFYSIALYRLKDYAAASIPVFPLKKGIYCTKVHMLCYVIAFIISASMLFLFGYTGYIYLTVIMILGFVWLLFAIKGFWVTDTTRWARKMFIFSLVIIVVICLMIAVDIVRPA